MHGSALTPRFDPGASDINLLLVVSELPFERLDAIAAAVRERTPLPLTRPRWMPLVLTETQIRGSPDVFPPSSTISQRGAPWRAKTCWLARHS
jgi:hypothetical protein